jgi:hypothetical protein
MQKHVSIWFVIGLQLLVLGLLIFGVSIYDVYSPPVPPPIYEELHPGIYWGGVMAALGLFYVIKFYPRPSDKDEP